MEVSLGGCTSSEKEPRGRTPGVFEGTEVWMAMREAWQGGGGGGGGEGHWGSLKSQAELT